MFNKTATNSFFGFHKKKKKVYVYTYGYIKINKNLKTYIYISIHEVKKISFAHCHLKCSCLII